MYVLPTSPPPAARRHNDSHTLARTHGKKLETLGEEPSTSFVHSPKCSGETRPPGANRNLRTADRNRLLPPGLPFPRSLRRKFTPVRTPEKALSTRLDEIYGFLTRLARLARGNLSPAKAYDLVAKAAWRKGRRRYDRLPSTRSIDASTGASWRGGATAGPIIYGVLGLGPRPAR